MGYLNLVLPSTLAVPQTEPLDARQVRNDAGGFVYAVSDRSRLERFLILGTEGGTYYKNQSDLTLENARHAMDMIQKDGVGVVALVKDVSIDGRAPKQDAGIFVLALCASYGDEATRQAAFAALPRVCRTHATLFQFVNFATQHRKWGAGLRRAVSNWYLEKSVEDMAYQMVKYRQKRYPRPGKGDEVWNARNIFRLVHPNVDEEDRPRRALIDWTMGRPDREEISSHASLGIVSAFEEAWSGNVRPERQVELAGLLTHEMIPDDWKANPAVWEALLARMPMTAMIRNLGNMTDCGLLTPQAAATQTIIRRLGDVERIRKARVHPAAILTALGIYESGGVGGRSKKAPFIPTRSIVAALDQAFYAAFANVVPSGKRHLIAIDCSASMEWPQTIVGPGLTSRKAATAMALMQIATEPQVRFVGFSSNSGRHRGGLTEIPAKPGHQIADVFRFTDAIRAGGTDCALPMVAAIENAWDVDVFQIYTDNETWHGPIHPMDALRRYRNKSGIDAKLVVAAMTPTEFSIADPNDQGTLDVVGFDAKVPKLIADFSRGAAAPAETADDE